MVELSLKVGNEEANMLDTAILIFSITNLAQWLFFIIVAAIIAKYIKKKNADPTTNKHS